MMNVHLCGHGEATAWPALEVTAPSTSGARLSSPLETFHRKVWWKMCLLRAFWWKMYLLHAFWWEIYLLHSFWWKMYLLYAFWWKMYLLYAFWWEMYLLYAFWWEMYLLYAFDGKYTKLTTGKVSLKSLMENVPFACVLMENVLSACVLMRNVPSACVRSEVSLCVCSSSSCWSTCICVSLYIFFLLVSVLPSSFFTKTMIKIICLSASSLIFT